jgi:hypothetical protein
MALAADAWALLRRAGARLGARGGALTLCLPADVEAAPLVALARASGAHLMPLASGRWRAELEGWPESMREAWAERAALREYEGGQARDEAEQAAFLDERERALRPHAETLAALARELGAVLIAIDATSVEAPPTPDGGPIATPRPPPQSESSPRVCRACGLRALEPLGCVRCGARPPPTAPP